MVGPWASLDLAWDVVQEVMGRKLFWSWFHISWYPYYLTLIKKLRPLWFSPRAVLWSNEHSPATNSSFQKIQFFVFLKEEGGGAGRRDGGAGTRWTCCFTSPFALKLGLLVDVCNPSVTPPHPDSSKMSLSPLSVNLLFQILSCKSHKGPNLA